jgi:pseudaminic acid cytidylyltransferase
VAPLNSVVIIPARGGSQRIPGKNTREIAGIPVLARTIAIAKAAGFAGAIFVSTDSPEIAALARSLKVEVIDRPADLADHYIPLLPVIQHSVSQLQSEKRISDSAAIACLYATAVTLNPGDLKAAGKQLVEQQSAHPDRFVLGVCEYSHPIQRALSLEDHRELRAISPEFAGTRTQDLPTRYFDAGAFIWGFTAAWEGSEPILARSTAFELPAWRSVDLDTESDWARAELVIQVLDARQR